MPGELGDGRVVEQLRQVHLPRILTVDLLVDLDELQGARAQLEEVVVDVHPLAAEGGLADGPQLLLDVAARSALRAALRRTQRRQSLQLRVALPVDITLLEQVPLDLAARPPPRAASPPRPLPCRAPGPRCAARSPRDRAGNSSGR